ncbi:MAG: sarcosine oxidase subunit gamma [Halocynthiibacter sp.]
MAKLIATSSVQGLLPVSAGHVRLHAREFDCLTLIQPFKGKTTAVGKCLKSDIGLGMPKTNHVLSAAQGDCVWFGVDQALLMGPAVPMGVQGLAALTDQSDGYVVLRLDGEGARDVLARLSTLDLRPSVFKVGHAARTGLGHMSVSLSQPETGCYDIVVMRSFAKTAIHEIYDAMKSVATRSET